MGIRASLKNQPVLQIVAAVAMIVVAAYFLRNAMHGSSGLRTKAYFTIDDGATQFVDSMDHLPPFDHNGKPAFRVWMYSIDGGETKFPVYLERYTPQALARLAPQFKDFEEGKTHAPPNVAPADTEIKKPGAANPWVSRTNLAQAQKVLQFQVPSGGVAEVQLPD